jgi:hypothetical protein
LEARVGLIRLIRDDSNNSISTPLLRLNYGLLETLELTADGANTSPR